MPVDISPFATRLVSSIVWSAGCVVNLMRRGWPGNHVTIFHFTRPLILTLQLPVNCRTRDTSLDTSMLGQLGWSQFLFSHHTSPWHIMVISLHYKKYLQLINFSLLLLVTSITDQRTGNHRQITAQYSTVQHSTEQPRNLFGAGRPRLGMVGASTRPQSSVVARLRAGEVTLGTRHHARHCHCLRRLRGETEILAISIKQKTLKMICPLLHLDCG